ncbi:serine hydrolase [Blastopirellula sp. JC732]|uniref:D-alanyl-D-alanine dipeptidase n=1 Tax=Blastopirellula sediminis TaxID=2894196 RepID=A0A9X1MHU7_9BACT|nr:serine hydrolase [Blastopirellula sediminis]MCC9607973.1 serine hydrolase [Blastopirellula sediminis]MCC9627234.1 serine hydrolase [Blastopirellula sediminis]
MTSSLSRLLWMGLLLFVMGAKPLFAQQPDYGDAVRLLQSAIEREVEQQRLPAFSISLVDDDRVVWSGGFGHQDADEKMKATAATIYRVGSISKLFTDIAVMQKVESGQLDLDAPVTQYLPDFQVPNPTETPITLRQLMCHRSGLVRESPIGNYFDPDEPSLTATVASLNDTKLVYPPGTKTKYSNAAIAVVGSVLEKVAGRTYDEQIRQSILQPLKMENSAFVAGQVPAGQTATGWMWTYDGTRFEAPTFALGTAPAGNLYSSTDDLAKFLVWLFQCNAGKSSAVLKPETLHQMISPTPDEHHAERREFGIGFHVSEFDGHQKVGHGGAVYGFATQLEALPERKLGVAAATSLDGANGVVQSLANYALRLMLAVQDRKPLPEYPSTAPIAAERAQRLVGSYREADGEERAEIEALGGEVYLQNGTFRRKLKADLANGEIRIDDVFGSGAKVALKGDNGLSIGEKSFVRLPDVPPVASPAEWNDLIGEYGWDHNVLYILERDGKLHALIEWFYEYPLTPLGDDEYAFPDYGLYHGERIHFVRDAEGKPIAATAASVRFDRREVGTKHGETFKITPLKPIGELRTAALAATPPKESGEFRAPELVDVTSLDPTIRLDIRYATNNNFMGEVFYKQAKAYLQRPAAEALVRVNERLREQGLGLLIHDAYRPWHVTKMFWDATPNEMRDFVANPANGSRHNRGCAVDLTLYDLETKRPIEMVATYDEFSSRSFPAYPGGTSRQRWYRQNLRRAMESEGFAVYEFEWWHFDYKDWKSYRIGNATFEELAD